MAKGIYNHKKHQGFQKGHKINQGKKYSADRVKKVADANRGRRKHTPNCYYCGELIDTSDGRQKFCNQSHAKKFGWKNGFKGMTGKTAWNKGTKGIMKPNSSSWKKRDPRVVGNKWNVGRKLTKEHISKALRRRGKSSLEIKFERIVNELRLPYKFVGNGAFFIERKNPDFINCNGQKIAVEVFYRRHKEQFRNGLTNWKKERQEIFNKYGWDVQFFNETEVRPEVISERLGGDYDC